ncbi:hypothetical protein [Granulicella arctica]|uniref:hypothetical protein n=1 Tax=Granulicella arctica TaxID=940613 RepID=UPI0021E08E01|nr:hypothetical protein [Granulicella arctica]
MKHVLRNLGCLLLLGCAVCLGQAAEPTDKPLPDIPALMHEVEIHQKASESMVKDYLYHSFATEQEQDSHGGVKKTETEESDIFYVAGARIRRVTKKDGKDLSPDEQKKETERIDKEIAKAKERQGKPTDEERDVVTVSRFLELGSFGNARRIALNGRDTVAVDFTGNPKAKTRSRFEGAIREMEGTVWVDEQDRSLRKIQGHFVNPFKVGGGLLADVKKDSSFEAEWTKVNGEVWLPSSASGQGAIRVLLLLNFHGNLRVVNSNYRKFKATATILPGLSTVEPDPQTPAPATPQ